jgi:low affinity Fe/Cu permease
MRNERHDRKSARMGSFREGKIKPGPVRRALTRFAGWASDRFGSPWAIVVAAMIIAAWLAAGPVLGWSDTHMLIINTITTVVTFLMVFVIQSTQTRETKAMNLKLDELLRATPRARNEFMEAEEEDLEEILREKEIVDAADPSPPEHKQRRRNGGKTERTAS